jgi:hypothetical protein
MTIGLRAFQGDRPTSLWWSLALPFSAAPDRPAGAK